MAKKKVVVKRKGATSTSNHKTQKHEYQNDSINLFDNLNDTNDTAHSSNNSKAAKLASLEKKVEKMENRQHDQGEFLTRIASICMNYASGIISMGIISAICVVMIMFVPKIIEANPSFSNAVPFVIGGIIIVWGCAIFGEFLRMRARHEEKAEKHRLF